MCADRVRLAGSIRPLLSSTDKTPSKLKFSILEMMFITKFSYISIREVLLSTM